MMLSNSLCLSLCLSLSVSLCRCLSVSVSLSLSVCLSLSLSLLAGPVMTRSKDTMLFSDVSRVRNLHLEVVLEFLSVGVVCGA